MTATKWFDNYAADNLDKVLVITNVLNEELVNRKIRYIVKYDRKPASREWRRRCAGRPVLSFKITDDSVIFRVDDGR